MTPTGQIRTGEKSTTPVPQKTQEVVEIDLVELLVRFLDKWYWIVISALICTALFAVYTFRFVTPQYQSTAKLYVVNSKNAAINLSTCFQ